MSQGEAGLPSTTATRSIPDSAAAKLQGEGAERSKAEGVVFVPSPRRFREPMEITPEDGLTAGHKDDPFRPFGPPSP